MLQIGTHVLKPDPDSPKNEFYAYYICETCGIIVYYTASGYMVSTASDDYLFDPTEITCDEWMIKSIIE